MMEMRFIIIAILSLFLTASAQNVKLTATVDRDRIGLDDQFTYQLEVSGSSQNLPEPVLPEFTGFNILSGPNVSSSYQIVNFDVKASKSYRFILVPQKTGVFQIPPAVAEYKGKKIQSNSIRIMVTKTSDQSGTQPGPRGKSGRGGRNDLSNSIFLKAQPSKRSVFVNEQVNVSYKLYFRINVRNPEFVQLPETVGFWVEEFPIEKNIPIRQETVNGIQYNVAEIKKMALFPTKAGELTVSPMRLKVDVVMQQRRRDPFNLFDDFFDSPFGRVVPKQFSTNSIKIKVKPLPEQGKPADFSGLVGDFRLSANLDKASVPANEALTFKVRISGSGNLKVLNEIPLDIPSSFEVFDPKIKNNINRSGTYLAESKEFEYVMIPRVPGEFKIKPIKISYFDPFQKMYKTLRTREYITKVIPGKEIAGGVATSYLAKEDVKLLGRDIHFIKEGKPNLIVMDYAPYKAVWFWLALFLPAIAVAGAYGYRNHLEKISTNLEYARKRKAHRQARQRLKQASQSLNNNNFSGFYAEISSALIGYVADKTNRPGAGLTRDEVDKILTSRNVDPQLITDYIRCLDEADFKRFAPGQASTDEANTFYKRAEDILVRIEKYF